MLAVVAIVFLVVTAPGEFAFIGDPQRMKLILAFRALDLAAAGVALFFVRRVATPRAFDAILTWWLGIWFVGIVAENALLPAPWTGFIVWDVFLVIVVYAATPLTLTRQAALGAVLSLGDLLVLWVYKSTDVWFSLLDVSLAYACANLVGVFLSHEHHNWRRRAFVALRREIAARAELQAALHEVKTLQGIIPICSYCRKVRTDLGAWEQLEGYVRARSEARFSHGICPRCAETRFPGLSDQVLEIQQDPSGPAADSREQ
ncbi:MAG: hypothetical protein ACYC3F_10165 [Gemmatimonadaceae bacterium]